MFCQNCGVPAEAGSICANCGAYVQASAPQASAPPPPPPAPQYPPQQPQYTQPTYQQPYGVPPTANPDDQPSTLLNLIGCCWPMPIGLIMYLVMKDNTPNKAKAIGKWALIGFIASMALGIIAWIIAIATGALAALSTGELNDILGEIEGLDPDSFAAALGGFFA